MSIGLLLSYHYFRRNNLAELFGKWRPLLFADSGAYSAANAGAVIDLDEYARWLQENDDRIDVRCTLDVIGDKTGEGTAVNTQRLEDLGQHVLPVFHVGEPWERLHYWCERYDYIGIGGMVPYSNRQKLLLTWIVKCLRIARDHDTVIHGLGLTTFASLRVLPLFSVDSSSWQSFRMFGSLSLWDDMRGWLILPAEDRRAWAREYELLRSYDIPARAAERQWAHLGARTDQAAYREERDILERASIAAWTRFADWWARRFAPIETPGLAPGPHVFLVCINPQQIRMLASVVNEES